VARNERQAQPSADEPQEDSSRAAFEAAMADAGVGDVNSADLNSADGSQPLLQDLARVRGELAEAQDRTLRVQAELENYRRRARREMEDERRYANLPLIRELLPVLDNLQRAIQAAEKTAEADSLRSGVKMVVQSLEGVLARHDAKRIDALHKPFDPAFHEAISQQPSADHPEHTVLLVAQDGYTLHDRVIRPAQVIVSTAPAAS
jgi:molecular chaperone GrpE